MLKKIKTETVYESSFVKLDKHSYVDLEDNAFECFTTNTSNGVLIVPIRIKDSKVSFVMTSQFRVGANSISIEFPKGSVKQGEAPESAAIRELLEETGLTAQSIRPFYSMYSSTTTVNNVMVYLAILSDEEPIAQDLGRFEKAADLQVINVTADDLLKMIKNNEIVDGQSLAAISVVMLQTGAAAQYLEKLGA